MANELYWAYVRFTDRKGGKTRPVLYIRQTATDYIILRISSKFANKSKTIQKKYVEIKDWKYANLPKPSWVDTVKIYELPISKTTLEYIEQLSSRDLQELSKHIKLS